MPLAHPGGPGRRKASPVYIEVGARRSFACSLEWPGLSRSGKGQEASLEALTAHLPRYGPVARRAGEEVPMAGQVRWSVVETVATRSGGADFGGAPTAVLESDAAPWAAADMARCSALLSASWAYLDEVVAGAPESLRKGPRGGGRDRDAVADHVAAAERAYASKLGLKLAAPKTGEQATVVANRSALLELWLSLPEGAPNPAPKGWPPRDAFRRLLWHVLDHAWEIEDRSQ